MFTVHCVHKIVLTLCCCQGDDEAISLLDYMKESTMLFQKAIYLEVLKNTASEKTLTTYLTKGGWDLLNQWLAGVLSFVCIFRTKLSVFSCPSLSFSWQFS